MGRVPDREKVVRSVGIFFFVGFGDGDIRPPCCARRYRRQPRSNTAPATEQCSRGLCPTHRTGSDRNSAQAERGEDGESAADPHHTKRRRLSERVSAAVQRKSAEAADDQRAHHIGENRAAKKSSRPVVAGRLEEARQLIDCMDRRSQSPDEERPRPAIRSVERSVSPIVIAVSAQGQLIALLDLTAPGDLADAADLKSKARF